MEQTNGTPSGRQLTRGQALRAVAFSVFWIVGGCALGLNRWHGGERLFAAVLLLAGVSHLRMLPPLWRQYVAARNGAIVYLRPPSETNLPKPLSRVVAFVLTLFVGAATAAFVAILVDARRPLSDWAVFGSIDVLLWAYVTFCWQRVQSGGRSQALPVPTHLPSEVIWPPPPTVSAAIDHKDS